MYPLEPNHHALQTDAGENLREVLDHYPVLIQSQTPGYHYKLVSLNIRPCLYLSNRWRTLSQWEPVPANFLDGLGTTGN